MTTATRVVPHQPTAPPPAGNVRSGVIVLSHPLVVLGTAVWLINDHVLKHTFASWWTGKLTDVVALVVFPLLVATVVERFTQHPLLCAISFTTVFYSAINVWPPADAATEWVMSLAIDSRLTMDPTDLLVLPAMSGACWLWTRPVASRSSLRRSWGRAIFIVGVATTIATSPDETRSETVRGTVLLTAERPTLSIPFTLTLDGEPAVHLDDALYSSVIYRSFTTTPPETIDAKPISIRSEKTGSGHGEIVITLNQLELAPVEAQWSVYAETYAETANPFWGDSAPDPVLVVDSPDHESGPEPFQAIEFVRSTFESSPAEVFELVVTLPADEQLLLLIPSEASQTIRAGTEDGLVTLRPGFLTPVSRPEACPSTEICSFTVWISSSGSAGGALVELHGPPGSSAETPIEHDLVLTTRTFQTDPLVLDANNPARLDADLQLPAAATVVDDLTMFVEIYGTKDAPNAAGDARIWTGESLNTSHISQAFPLAECCSPFTVIVSGRPEDGRGDEGMFEAIGEVTIDVWSLTAHDPAEIVLDLSD